MARSEGAVRQAIESLELEDVLARVIADRHWTEQQAQEALLWYRNFLWLAYKHWDSPVRAINQDSDFLWHAHITFTKKYASDCKRIFGKFLDHNPSARRPTRQDRDLFEESLSWYQAEFDSTPPNPIGECYISSGKS